MEVKEKSAADLKLKEEEEEEEPGFNGPGFPPPSEAQPTNALAALASTFPPGLWNPPGHSPSFGLGESSASAMANGHHFSSFLGMLSVPAACGGAPAGGFMDCGAGFGGLSGSSLGAMMDHPFPGSRHLGGFENGAVEPPREMSVVDEGRHTEGSYASNSELSRPECSGGAAGQDQDERPSASCAKKRKRPGQDRGAKHVQEGSQQLPTVVAKQEKDDDGDAAKSEPKRPAAPSRKSNGKQTEEDPDAPKQDYIHIRARSGQATNSHSLAERVRREKISERMKFLQDLVPGCSKVIGKAVMLDEIINYVQSLQRQVEFLSMKLSAVNPALEFNIERILSKDFFQSQGPASSAFGFLPDVGHQFLHPPKHSQAAFHGMVNSTDAFGRVANGPQGSSSAFNEPTHQVPSNFDGEFHNVAGTPFTLFNDQEPNGKP